MSNQNVFSVAIDGPAGVGKSTVAKLVAEKLGWKTLETGAIYRALTVACLSQKIDLDDESAIVDAVARLRVAVEYASGAQRVIVNGVDFGPYLRMKPVDQNVALVAKVPDVRHRVLLLQRQIATNNNVVVEGRDIGTVVLPDSLNKIFLTASAEVRAKRRLAEVVGQENKIAFDDILQDILLRDKLDAERKVSPLRPAQDAFVLDTSLLTIDEVVRQIVCKVKTKNFEQEKTM